MNLLFILGAKYLFIVNLIISGIYFFKQERSIQKKIALFALTSFAVIYLLAFIAGHLYFNPRPFVVEHFTPLIPHSADNGFPSDHVLLVSAISAVFLYINRKVAISLWIITILVAISRVYVGVHHPIDVVASMILSLIGTAVVFLIMQHGKNKSINQQ